MTGVTGMTEVIIRVTRMITDEITEMTAWGDWHK